jgi:hypothetical protein
MRYEQRISAAALLLCAGFASGQVAVDGKLSNEEKPLYGPILWVQNQPTSFGDNYDGAGPPPGELGNPGEVATGVEIAIPLSALGNPAGDIAFCAIVNGGGHGFVSNQVLAGLPSDTTNLAEPRGVDFGDHGGNQWAKGTPATVQTPPIVDGTRDAGYGNTALAVQTCFTQFGDASQGNIDFCQGSELDGLYVVKTATHLYILLAGNLESNGNTLELFFDTKNGGQNRLRGDNPNIDSNGLNRIGDDGTGNGLTFDATFSADYYFTMNGSDVGGVYGLRAYFAQLPTNGGGNGWYLGAGTAGGAGTLVGGDGGAPVVLASINNSNVEGVVGNPVGGGDQAPHPDFAYGSELDGLYGYASGGTLHLLLTGNLQSNYNKLNLFLDVAPGGQSPLRGDNVDISFGGLNKQGDNGTNPGVTFDAGFAADYWLDFNTGGLPIQQWTDSAILRTDGPAEDFSGNHLDYGCYDGGDKPEHNPVNFDGPRIDGQDGFTPQLYSNYAPGTSYDALQEAIDNGDPFDPSPYVETGLLFTSINNSNVEGVTDVSVDGAADVTTGIEIAIDLGELGWDGASPIKVAGYIANGDFTFVSNQAIGGLPFPDQLGDPTLIDFGAIAGNQYVVIPVSGCYPDLDGSGELDFFDFLEFVNLFNDGDPLADCEANGIFDFFDFLCYLNAFNEGC